MYLLTSHMEKRYQRYSVLDHEPMPTHHNCIQMCHNFLAGDALRSSKRYNALDETALFGCACRHEFPMLFVNLKHGER